MAYALRKIAESESRVATGIDRYFFDDIDELEVRFSLNALDEFTAISRLSGGGTPQITTRIAQNQFDVAGFGFTNLPSGTSYQTGVEHKIRMVKVSGNNYDLFFDDVFARNETNSFDFFWFGFAHSGSGSADFRSLKIKSGGVTTLYYDPSASNGTGSILPETAGGQDGTLEDFPTDDSQWVFYEDGGAVDVSPTTATSTSDSPNPAIASGASVTATTAVSTSEALSPTATTGASVAPTAAGSTSTANAPAVSSGASASPTVAMSTGTALEPQVTTDQSVLVEPTASESVSVSPDPVISAGANVRPTVAASVSAANDPVIGIAVVVSPTIAESVSEPLAPTATSGASASPATVYSDSAANDPVVSTAANVFPLTARSAGSALDPLVSGGLARYVVKKTINGVYYRELSIRGQFPRRLTLR